MQHLNQNGKCYESCWFYFPGYIGFWMSLIRAYWEAFALKYAIISKIWLQSHFHVNYPFTLLWICPCGLSLSMILTPFCGCLKILSSSTKGSNLFSPKMCKRLTKNSHGSHGSFTSLACSVLLGDDKQDWKRFYSYLAC